ncbi:MAG: hypothetical protein KDJ31_07305, partial [Candidatus Competibacteraceae bacterium]|nr:hypothetical protein [Candidatus Competibacteraceae bacterium]
ERQNRLQHEATLMRQLESIQRERSELQHHLTNAQERLEQSTAALETLNVTLGQCEEQVQETGHALEIMRVRLETEVDLRQRLEQEATEMRKLLKEIMTRLDNKP